MDLRLLKSYVDLLALIKKRKHDHINLTPKESISKISFTESIVYISIFALSFIKKSLNTGIRIQNLSS